LKDLSLSAIPKIIDMGSGWDACISIANVGLLLTTVEFNYNVLTKAKLQVLVCLPGLVSRLRTLGSAMRWGGRVSTPGAPIHVFRTCSHRPGMRRSGPYFVG
jgi:hypothetical protein